jgi:hypothetical protein
MGILPMIHGLEARATFLHDTLRHESPQVLPTWPPPSITEGLPSPGQSSGLSLPSHAVEHPRETRSIASHPRGVHDGPLVYRVHNLPVRQGEIARCFHGVG